MYLLYSIATLIALVALSPYFLYQAMRHKKYAGSLGQRLGYLPVSFNLDADESIWIHAVSVGEVLSARPVISELRRRYPGLRLFLSTTTLSGQQLARRSVTEADAVFYFPLDWGFAVRRTLDIVKPRLLVLVEKELWPNVLRECRSRGVATMVISGRVSRRSFARYRLVRPLFRRVLAHIDRFCVQNDEMARRLTALGADPARIAITGSLKFDSLNTAVPGRGAARVLRFFRVAPHRPVFIAGSTDKGEDQAVIRAFNRVRATSGGANALLVIAPRHPERFGDVERLCRLEGLSTARRSGLPIDSEPREDAIVLDTIGELSQLYQIATAVFVGGSLLAGAGGHNILEPALHGKPIVIGPHMENWSEIADTFVTNDAAIRVHSGRELEDAVVDLMGDPVRRARLGAAARALIDANRGAKDRTLTVIAGLLPERTRPAVVRPFRVVH